MFLKTLQQLRQGNLMDELDQQLYDLVQVVKHTGKGGVLNVKLKIAPLTQSATAVQIEDEITVKEPKMPREKTVMFTTEAGELVRHDPRQGKLELKEAGGTQPAASLRDVAG